MAKSNPLTPALSPNKKPLGEREPKRGRVVVFLPWVGHRGGRCEAPQPIAGCLG